MDELYVISYWIGAAISSVICGVITSVINGKKGYDGGFWWGFFLGIIGILIVTLRTDKDDQIMDREQVARENEKFYEHDGWECPCCNRLHGLFETECVCGFSLNEEAVNEEEEKRKETFIKAAESEEKLISKYKEMFDSGLISEEEFVEKKKKILGI